jgi:invasion protein IalB
MRPLSLLFLAFSTATCLLPIPQADAQTLHLTVKNWRTYTHADATGTQCYVTSSPVSQSGNDKGRADPFVIVTRTSAHKNEVSVSSGYPYRAGSDVVVSVDKAPYHFFAKADRAWTKDGATDKMMVEKMKRGNTVIVKGVSKKGYHSQDTYSLSGFTKAYQKMDALCR